MLDTPQLLALHLLVLEKHHDLNINNLKQRLEKVGSLPFEEVVRSIYKHCTDAEIAVLKERADSEIAKVAELDILIVTLMDSRYPARLKKLSNPPLVLFVKGDLDALNTEQSLAVVGSRAATDTAKIAAHEIAKHMADKGTCIVSGLALGCDTAGHLGALDSENGKTVAVLAHGLDKVSPVANIPLAKRIVESGGCLVSIYPIGVPPTRERYYDRNGIQTGLADATVIVQAAKVQCGTMATAKHCREQHRILFCLDPAREPNPKIRKEQYKGNDKLIKDSVRAVTNAETISHTMNAILNKTFPMFFRDTPFNAAPAPKVAATKKREAGAAEPINPLLGSSENSVKRRRCKT